MDVSIEEFLRLKLQEGAIKIYQKGLVQAGEGTSSLRIPNREELIITPTYNKYENLKTSDLVHMKFDGSVLSKNGAPSTEYQLHVEVYKARPNAMCVLHTHSPYATMMSVARIPVPILLEEQVIFIGGSVNISEFSVAHSWQFSSNAIKALGTKNGALLANHGTLACGKNIDDTIKVAELIEKLAFIYIGAKGLGQVYDIAGSSCTHFYENFEKSFATHAEKIGKCS